MTQEKKLKALQEVWGYVEVSQVTLKMSGWSVWLVKNYEGRPISEIAGHGLPGNPKATKRIEFSGANVKSTIGRAYSSTIRKRKKQGQ